MKLIQTITIIDFVKLRRTIMSMTLKKETL